MKVLYAKAEKIVESIVPLRREKIETIYF